MDHALKILEALSVYCVSRDGVIDSVILGEMTESPYLHTEDMR